MNDSALFSTLDTIDSTNNYAMGQVKQGRAKDGSCWYTREQLLGRGQRGKTWKSEKDKDIAMSIAIKPASVFQQYPFMINAIISTTVQSVLSESGLHESFCIKWPNDILWNDKKTAGILIENVYSGKDLLWCVIGIGINIKKKVFPSELPKAVAVESITKKELDPETLAREIHERILSNMKSFKDTEIDSLMDTYNANLYQQGKWVKFKKESVVFESKVIKVNKYGELITEDVMERQFHFGELQWVLEADN